MMTEIFEKDSESSPRKFMICNKTRYKISRKDLDFVSLKC